MTQDLRTVLSGLADEVVVRPVDLPAVARAGRARRRRRRAAWVAPVVALAVAAPVALAARQPTAVPDRLRPATPAPSEQPETVSVGLRHVAQMHGSAFGMPTVEFDPGRVTVGKDITPDRQDLSSVAVAFDPSPVAAECIDRAELRLPAPEVDGTPELRAYPSAATSLAAGRLPPAPERASTLIDNRPSGRAVPAAGQPTTFNVTDLVRIWAAGGSFPSRGRSVPAGTPIVLLLRAPAADAGTYSATYALSGDGPSLVLTVAATCPAAR